jgi:hypothetical protein
MYKSQEFRANSNSSKNTIEQQLNTFYKEHPYMIYCGQSQSTYQNQSGFCILCIITYEEAEGFSPA